ncbi:MAG TPA: type IV pilus secretin PilQ [Steroidobacteraceae bacterium]|nr:type IV pilus secretin PilQ [Steroidobacteraceae bacterium]
MKRHNPSTRPARTLALAAAALIIGAAAAPLSAAETNSLKSIDVRPLAGQQVQLTLHLAAPAPQPLSFTIDNPARISIDLPNTDLALPSRRIDVNSGGVDEVVAVEAKDRARLVLDLDRMMPYTMQVAGNDIVVTVGQSPAGAAAAAAVASTAAQSPAGGGAAAADAAPATQGAAASAPAGPRAISSIDFRRSSDGAGRVIVRLTDPHTAINLRQVGNQIVVDFAGTEVPASLMRRYDATDFGTPVSGFDVTHSGDNTEIVINAKGDYDQLAYQSDDQYVVEVQPQRKTAASEAQKRKYTGEHLTLNFQDVSTRSVLQLLAETSGQNIVVSDSVKGDVTLRLQNVPWDQALDILLQTKGLGKRQEGNVIIVAPAEELAAREKAELAATKDVQELEPLRSEFLQVNYAKAADLAALIKSQSGSLLSTRGTVSVDDRTNTLLVQDTPERITDIRRLVATLDIPVRQVLIEARLVIVTDDFKRELGARLGYTGINRNGANGIVTTSGTAAGADTIVSSALNNIAGGKGPFPVNVPTGAAAPERYNVNLPTPDAAGSIALGILGADYLLDLELSAAQAETRADVVSAPRVITANQKKATIEQGTEIPYQQSASSGATTIAFKKAVLSLEVTPQITPDNRIILDLDVKKDTVGQVVVASGGVNVPSIDTQEITNQVIVNDGQTVVLGGILQTEHREDVTKVPWLGDIPVLGNLFKETTSTNNKDELLIFVTPKIVHEGVNVY